MRHFVKFQSTCVSHKFVFRVLHAGHPLLLVCAACYICSCHAHQVYDTPIQSAKYIYTHQQSKVNQVLRYKLISRQHQVVMNATGVFQRRTINVPSQSTSFVNSYIKSLPGQTSIKNILCLTAAMSDCNQPPAGAVERVTYTSELGMPINVMLFAWCNLSLNFIGACMQRYHSS